ncbi:uncharacterized protein [Clinocottus analis]|uniref:uncharacterized protein n=1 Tax=Clinocottus analis TaxID=304258 RepID=UPI0035C17A93
MNSEGHNGSRRPTLPPLSSRTLHHPSLMPMFLPAGFAHHVPDCRNQTLLPIIPADFFYIDPTMGCGQRVPNIVTELGVLDCFQLNTPTPVMSAFPAPPTRPDPFRSGPHPSRDLGSLTFTVKTLHIPVQPRQVVLQLTQEEDQAITNLLKLHHQEEPLHWGSAEGVFKPLCNDVPSEREASLQSQLQQRRCWSDTELEAAHTLSNGFRLMEEDNISSLNYYKPAATRPDPPLYQHPEESSTNTESQHKAQYNVSYIDFSCAMEYGETGSGDLGFVVKKVVDVHLPARESSLSSDSKTNRGSSASEVKWTLSDSEGEAVGVLLSLGDADALAIV